MRRLPLLLALAGPLLASPAFAQMGGGMAGRGAPPPAGNAARPPPPALPGLANRRAVEPIPAETPSANLSPNDAIFDAVNRGDLGAVKEAMSRGADLNARNQLGLTPVDAAVDQGRTEIAFYLLSARGSAGSGPTMAPEPTPTPAPAPAAGRGRNGREAPAAARAEEAGPARPSALLSDPPRGGRTAPTAPSAPVRARLFAGDGGSPRPEIGFLGFDAGRPAGAEPLPEAVERPAARRGRRA
ncbi:ankyrin repeat domain-containing protein [Roseomonas populi]|uniref:Ankyrin repeat domain-containing protein n=1 Tax=Roseomonas populi TaxID=3121582 RepID=A0ABT1X6I0_9PROT|nr:ankyrin repeat domain-containing protein [Roseomonas pecuniae]MCR0982998.1 ankyrin repeat domain-containing protein [Roseomonas pecuniae]